MRLHTGAAVSGQQVLVSIRIVTDTIGCRMDVLKRRGGWHIANTDTQPTSYSTASTSCEQLSISEAGASTLQAPPSHATPHSTTHNTEHRRPKWHGLPTQTPRQTYMQTAPEHTLNRLNELPDSRTDRAAAAAGSPRKHCRRRPLAIRSRTRDMKPQLHGEKCELLGS